MRLPQPYLISGMEQKKSQSAHSGSKANMIEIGSANSPRANVVVSAPQQQQQQQQHKTYAQMRLGAEGMRVMSRSLGSSSSSSDSLNAASAQVVAGSIPVGTGDPGGPFRQPVIVSRHSSGSGSSVTDGGQDVAIHLQLLQLQHQQSGPGAKALQRRISLQQQQHQRKISHSPTEFPDRARSLTTSAQSSNTTTTNLSSYADREPSITTVFSYRDDEHEDVSSMSNVSGLTGMAGTRAGSDASEADVLQLQSRKISPSAIRRTGRSASNSGSGSAGGGADSASISSSAVWSPNPMSSAMSLNVPSAREYARSTADIEQSVLDDVDPSDNVQSFGDRNPTTGLSALNSGMKSLSMVNLSRFSKQTTAAGTLRRLTPPDFHQILNFLYIGRVDSAHNTLLLCQNQIEYLVDLASVDAEVPNTLKGHSYCLCQANGGRPHARATITVDIPMGSRTATPTNRIVAMFEEVNSFIERARSQKKSTLIYGSKADQERCIIVIIQYLMAHMRTNVPTALQYLTQKCPRLDSTINRFAREQLEKWELVLNDPKRYRGQTQTAKPTKKIAWN